MGGTRSGSVFLCAGESLRDLFPAEVCRLAIHRPPFACGGTGLPRSPKITQELEFSALASDVRLEARQRTLDTGGIFRHH